MSCELVDKIKNTDFAKVFAKKGYAYFTKGDYNVNIIGIRNTKTQRVTNRFDDVLILEYKIDGKPIRHVYDITTDPGIRYVIDPANNKGVAILVPGQYRGVYAIDYHNGKYKALCQRKGPVKVYRDNNKDKVYDCNVNTIDTGWFGINIHRSHELYERATIDGYSAGCQVFDNPNAFDHFMKIIKKSAKLYGNKFTYTLLTEDDL